MSLDLDRSTWQRVKFGDVVRNVNENVKDPDSAGIDRAIGLEHLDPGELRIGRWGELTEETTFTRRVRPGQTLFGKRRAYQRKTAYAEFDAVCSGDILVFESADSQVLIPELLPFIAMTDAFYSKALETSAGSLSPRTRWSDLATYELDLPPLADQRRIADLLWAIEGHRQGALSVANAARCLLNAQRATLGSHGERATAGQAFDILMGRQRAPKYEAGVSPTPYLRAANVKPSRLELSEVLVMDFDAQERIKFGLAIGDVLVTEGCGSPDEIGAAAVYDGNPASPVCFQNTLLRFRAVPGVSNPRWMYHWCQGTFETGGFKRVSVGTGILHIGASRAAAMPLHLPSVEDQVEEARRLDEAEDVLRAVKVEVKALGALQQRTLGEILP